MRRSQLLNFIIRLAREFSRREQKAANNKKVSDNYDLPLFFKAYFDPIIGDSFIIEHRKLIRASKRLNELIYHNSKNLRLIFDDAAKKDKAYAELGLSSTAARLFFSNLK